MPPWVELVADAVFAPIIFLVAIISDIFYEDQATRVLGIVFSIAYRYFLSCVANRIWNWIKE
jgi:hypothetical protein